MKRFRDDRPADICFARGTFNSHPYVMGAMNEFLRRSTSPDVRALYAASTTIWNGRAQRAQRAPAPKRQLPVRVANLSTIWTVCYTAAIRYNWMFQYYLRARRAGAELGRHAAGSSSASITPSGFRGGGDALRRRRRGHASRRLVVARARR